MPNSGDNIRFQVLINGKHRTTAGMESDGVLSAILNWVFLGRKKPQRKSVQPDTPNERQDNAHDLWFRMGGLDCSKDEHVKWLTEELKVGDEVTARILPGGKFDRPVKREPSQKNRRIGRKSPASTKQHGQKSKRKARS